MEQVTVEKEKLEELEKLGGVGGTKIFEKSEHDLHDKPGKNVIISFYDDMVKRFKYNIKFLDDGSVETYQTDIIINNSVGKEVQLDAERRARHWPNGTYRNAFEGKDFYDGKVNVFARRIKSVLDKRLLHCHYMVQSNTEGTGFIITKTINYDNEINKCELVKHDNYKSRMFKMSNEKVFKIPYKLWDEWSLIDGHWFLIHDGGVNKWDSSVYESICYDL